ncbi:hypothetical protein M8C21_014280 [Ambrosia artemisiifolia]|uniref:Uncharacterized protein n=1 Tax=Ambrosia artemisiifolia TaxID=4212 RepID=A0AAD5D4H3_AMBAR|nr:hypothetical protein M8C21_014280 [Ambrosia artemisiifolia]
MVVSVAAAAATPFQTKFRKTDDGDGGMLLVVMVQLVVAHRGCEDGLQGWS